jgi:hypothetical protein
MNFSKKSFWLIPIIGLFLFIGCGEDYQYKKAKEANTIEKYESFIEKYPDSKYSKEIKTLLNTLLNPYPIYLSWVEDITVKDITKSTDLDDLPDINYNKKDSIEINKVTIKMKFLTLEDGELIEHTMGMFRSQDVDKATFIRLQKKSGLLEAPLPDGTSLLKPYFSMLYHFFPGEGKTQFALFDTLENNQLSNWLEIAVRVSNDY